ncbi:MAG: polysaccharide deacetylase family protein [Bdellovibrionaceae bacterium]|jgi:peptidoglycan/xylan/chitin deacetylase (PgdA/CDA1 family)|nr:polysaccharide deacetylase family protein [Pseudobdellovibrionaceae bacterium]
MKIGTLIFLLYAIQSFAITTDVIRLKIRDSHLIFDDKLGPEQIAITFAGRVDVNVVKKILDKLDKEKLNGHFFLTGDDAVKNPELVYQILSKGHILGSQGMAAPTNKERVTNEPSMEAEIQTGHEAVFFSAGAIYPFVRLSRRQGGIAVREMIKENGAFAFYWNIEYYSENPAQSIRDNLEREKYRGIVALTLSRDSSLVALDALIEEVKDRDLTVVTILPNEESPWIDYPPMIRKSLKQEVFKNGSLYSRKLQLNKDNEHDEI